MFGSLHTIDSCRVWLGYGDGDIAGATLPERFTWPRSAPTFPPDIRERAPLAAHVATSVWWSWESDRGEREAFFIAASPSAKWSWILFGLTWDDDAESWTWFVKAATDRDFPDERAAAGWLLESAWYWDAARLGRRVALFDGIWGDALLAVDDVWVIGQRTLIPWPSDPAALFRPTPFLRLTQLDGSSLIVNMNQVTRLYPCESDPSRTTLYRTRRDDLVDDAITVQEDLATIMNVSIGARSLMANR